MRSEEELKIFLKRCRAVSGFGMSEGPCPIEEDKPEIPLDIKEDDPHYEMMLEHQKDKRGCCAECSFPSAIEWVLGGLNDPTENGQNRLINLMRGDISGENAD
jgi:hypothetical protein